MIQTNYPENIYANLVKDLKKELNRDLKDEELTFLKWLAQESEK